jgi:hypothetical protein
MSDGITVHRAEGAATLKRFHDGTFRHEDNTSNDARLGMP